MAVIDADAIRVILDGTPILEDVSLAVAAGQIVSVLGPSGCGKTTLLRALAGLIPIQGGAITSPGDTPGAAGVRMVFQDPRLLPWLRVGGNIRFALEAAGVPRAHWPARIAPLMEAVGLSAVEGLWPSALSGGMAQRVALVRALAVHPAALLLDEPFAALDPQRRESLQDDLQALVTRTGCAAVIVTHDVTEALVLGDEVIVLGGSPGTVLARLCLDAPRPRGSDFRLSDQTLRLRRQVRTLLEAASR